MVERNNMFSALRWESIIGYSRVVKYGQQIFISGTTSIDEKGIVVGAGDVYLQTKNIIQIIEKSLKKTNANLTNIVRTRMFVTNIQEWESMGKAYAKYFRYTACINHGRSKKFNPTRITFRN